MVENPLILAPSILAADCAALGEAVGKIKSAGLSWVHFDVMDAHFVPNLSFGPQFLKSLRALYPDMFFDVHLMMDNPHLYIDAFASAGASLINVHIEPDFPIAETLREIHLKGLKAGITIKPKTSVYELAPYLPFVDLAMLMTVEPGFGGQKFIENSYEKIAAIKKLRDEMKLNFRIEVDGGITPENIANCAKAGADTIVAGTAFFKHEKELMAAFKNA
ncbi:MAG: ribulose-phosphate 3-epimerase [Opitutales bacterium]|nr:ribulose-phosphate 3-epimerase [Opitutales bacterium]